MFINALKRICRVSLPTIGVILFAVIMSAVLCGLHASNEAELQSYNETYHAIPVRFSVTNLTGTRSEKLHAPGWVADLFTGGSWLSPDLSEFATDVQIKMAIDIADRDDASVLVGLTSLAIAKELHPENGCTINWYDSYDATILTTDKMVCIVPQKILIDNNTSEQVQELELKFMYTPQNGTLTETKEYTCKLTVVGTYVSINDEVIYCPYSVVEKIYLRLGRERDIDAISALLIDNDDLEKLRTSALYWFAEPNATGSKTKWDFGNYEYFPYALDINDDLLQKANIILQNSLTVNRICSVLVFSLSAGAGFFLGLLMIRSRKREIFLMRTLGTANGVIFVGFLLEQLFCVMVGTLLGGGAFLWNPFGKLAVFMGVYAVGLAIALLVLLQTNLLTAFKEDE